MRGERRSRRFGGFGEGWLPGWLGSALGVGRYWVPAGDAGMAEGDEDGWVRDAAPTEDRTEGWFETVFR